MAWESYTGLFSPAEMRALETASVQDLAGGLSKSEPIVVLRTLAELLGQDPQKFDQVLRNSAVSRRWRDYGQDPRVQGADHYFARMLRQYQPKPRRPWGWSSR